MELVNIDNRYTALRIVRQASGSFDVWVSVAADPINRHDVSFLLTKQKFCAFVAALDQTGKSRHGHVSLMKVRAIYLEPKYVATQEFRDITIYWASWGSMWQVPATLSTEMVRAIKAVKLD